MFAFTNKQGPPVKATPLKNSVWLVILFVREDWTRIKFRGFPVLFFLENILPVPRQPTGFFIPRTEKTMCPKNLRKTR